MDAPALAWTERAVRVRFGAPPISTKSGSGLALLKGAERPRLAPIQLRVRHSSMIVR